MEKGRILRVVNAVLSRMDLNNLQILTWEEKILEGLGSLTEQSPGLCSGQSGTPEREDIPGNHRNRTVDLRRHPGTNENTSNHFPIFSTHFIREIPQNWLKTITGDKSLPLRIEIEFSRRETLKITGPVGWFGSIGRVPPVMPLTAPLMELSPRFNRQPPGFNFDHTIFSRYSSIIH